MELEDIRREIDHIDGDIILLLSKRSKLVTAAGKLKKDEHGVRDPKRVEQVIKKIRVIAAETGLTPDIAEQIYRTIITCFIAKEMNEFQSGEHT